MEKSTLERLAESAEEAATDAVASEIQAALPQHPVLIPGYKIVPAGENAIGLRRGRRFLWLRGRVSQVVLRLIAEMDGKQDVNQLAANLHLDPRQVTAVLTRLHAANLLTDGDTVLAKTDRDFGLATLLEVMTSPGTQGHMAYRHLQNHRAVVLGQSELSRLVCEQLRQCGVDVQACKPTALDFNALSAMRPTFCICAEQAANYQMALHINELALRLSIPWLAGWLEDEKVLVTHVMVPGENACFECLLIRQRGSYTHFDAGMAYEQLLRDGPPDAFKDAQGFTPGLVNLLATLLAMRALSYLAGWRPGPPVPRLLEFSTLLLESQHHPVIRLPYCPACGPASLRQKTLPFITLSPEDKDRSY